MIKVTGRNLSFGPGVTKLNQHVPEIYAGVAPTEQPKAQSPVSDAPRPGKGDRASVKRIRQESGLKLNKLESEWLARLKWLFPADTNIYAQSWRVRLANGVWFKVDFCALLNGVWTAWEVKGPKQGKNVDRGLLALKVAAAQYPEINWNLVWKQDGIWQMQRVLA
jgi:hypothetical protein